MYLLNKVFVGWVIGAAAPELCQKCDFFLKKRIKECLCSGIYAFILYITQRKRNTEPSTHRLLEIQD